MRHLVQGNRALIRLTVSYPKFVDYTRPSPELVRVERIV